MAEDAGEKIQNEADKAFPTSPISDPEAYS
jgi:hypothetical protein